MHLKIQSANCHNFLYLILSMLIRDMHHHLKYVHHLKNFRDYTNIIHINLGQKIDNQYQLALYSNLQVDIHFDYSLIDLTQHLLNLLYENDHLLQQLVMLFHSQCLKVENLLVLHLKLRQHIQFRQSQMLLSMLILQNLRFRMAHHQSRRNLV